MFLCGPQTASLDTICNGLMQRPYHWQVGKLPDIYDSKFDVEAVHFVQVVLQRHDIQSQKPLKSMTSNVSVFCGARASDPRDNVYGLLGISGKYMS